MRALKLLGDSLSELLVVVEAVANDANHVAQLVDGKDLRRRVGEQLPL